MTSSLIIQCDGCGENIDTLNFRGGWLHLRNELNDDFEKDFHDKECLLRWAMQDGKAMNEVLASPGERHWKGN